MGAFLYMGLQLVPSIDDVYRFIKVMNKSEVRSHQLVADLKCTALANLWPDLPSLPPANQVGVIFEAAQNLSTTVEEKRFLIAIIDLNSVNSLAGREVDLDVPKKKKATKITPPPQKNPVFHQASY